MECIGWTRVHHRRTQSYDGPMRAAILTFASLLLLASPALAVPADPPAAPVKPVGKPMKGPMTQADMKVIADPAGLDFGIVAPHTVLEGNFTLVNTTDKPLTVQQAVPSCQCTTIEIVGKQIPPRASDHEGEQHRHQDLEREGDRAGSAATHHAGTARRGGVRGARDDRRRQGADAAVR
ncbi:MAG: DUF1573 domain-containing protein [Planctomycetes bacterium]|nr:DUF1573 domain-containing protein [Planctomycetota bacterium]